MNALDDSRLWLQYIETPSRKSGPVKLDQILAARLKAFLEAKRAKNV